MPKQDPGGPAPILVAVAAPAEADAVWSSLGGTGEIREPWRPAQARPGWWVVRTGVGKANAAGAVASALAARGFSGVLNAGVCGSLPTGDGNLSVSLLDVVVADRCVMADEGLDTRDGFVSCAEMGFPSLVLADDLGAEAFDPRGVMAGVIAPVEAARASIATVSLCAGTDARARWVAERTGAPVEAMEGAAAALACVRAGVPFAELRVVSNTTGDREHQRWDLAGALARLSEIFGRFA